MDIQTAQNAALAAIARLADAGHRAANEHAYALDQLRQENEALRRQNQALREIANGAGPDEQRFLLTLDQAIALVEGTWEGISADLPKRVQAYLRGLKPAPDVQPVDTEAPVREVVRGDWKGLPHMVEPGYRTGADMPVCREAVQYNPGWSLVDSLGRTRARCATESQAIAWVLDGVLP